MSAASNDVYICRFLVSYVCRLALLTAQQTNARVVLVDFGPSSGILNQVFVMSCDYILPPCFADFYSICSADGFLRSLLPLWLDWHADLLQREPGRISQGGVQQLFKFKPTPPKILPFLVTAYKMNYPRECVAKPSSQWILDLQDLVMRADLDPRVTVSTTAC